MKQTKINKIFYIVLVLAITFSVECCFGAKSERVAIIPFTMNSSQDLSFLQNGIFDMLSSRLTDEDKVSVLTRDEIDNVLEKASQSVSAQGKLDRTKARIIGANLGVEYVLFGSLTIIGDNVSLDAQMVDVAGDKPDVTFSKQAEKLGGVIPLVNIFANDVNKQIFNRDVGQEREQRRQQYAREQGGGQYPADRGGYYDDGMQGQQGEGYYASPLSRFRSLMSVKGSINGISIGDVNGDKKNEVVVVHGNIVEIFAYNSDGGLTPVNQLKYSSLLDIISLDVADINNNGIAEIFVTRNKPDEQRIESHVVEFDGKQYKKGKKTYPWYFKVVRNPGEKGTLYAQKNLSKKGPYASKDVFKVNWIDKRYVRGERLRVPKGFSILSMQVDYTSENSIAKYIFTDDRGRLNIFDESGTTQWLSEGDYGGSMLFYALPKLASDGGAIKGVYFQPKNILFDIDKDGQNDLIAISNTESSDYLFDYYRSFKKGSLELLELNEMGAMAKNAPKKIPGQITSIEVGDFDNDSKMELLVGFVKKKSGMSMSKTQSLLILYEFKEIKKKRSSEQ